jgi:predicted enzyme related to lactoylglutathione lyase
MVVIASMVLFAADLERTADFYRLLGITLEPERHDDGRLHAAGEVAGVHVAVYDAGPPAAPPPGFREAGSTFTGFYVDSLDDALAAVAGLGVRVLAAHEVRPWGCRAVVLDPDGRAVEVNQRNHCP